MRTSEHAESVMVSVGTFEERVVHTTRRHPQVGFIHYEGKKQRVFIGFWVDCPVWRLVQGPCEEPEYDYCAQRTMDIEDDPDYCGEEGTYGNHHYY